MAIQHVHHVCHLMAAGVPIKTMVAGISCGLVTGETDDDYVFTYRYSGT